MCYQFRHGRLALVVNSGCLLYYLCCPIGGWDFDSCADIFAIIGRGLYGEVDPARFGNLGRACFTLFQLITLDDWFFMYSTVRDEHPGGRGQGCGLDPPLIIFAPFSLSSLEHGHIIVYLLLFTIMETFIFIKWDFYTLLYYFSCYGFSSCAETFYFSRKRFADMASGFA